MNENSDENRNQLNFPCVSCEGNKKTAKSCYATLVVYRVNNERKTYKTSFLIFRHKYYYLYLFTEQQRCKICFYS